MLENNLKLYGKEYVVEYYGFSEVEQKDIFYIYNCETTMLSSCSKEFKNVFSTAIELGITKDLKDAMEVMDILSEC